MIPRNTVDNTLVFEPEEKDEAIVNEIYSLSLFCDGSGRFLLQRSFHNHNMGHITPHGWPRCDPLFDSIFSLFHTTYRYMTWPLWVFHQQFCHMVFSVGLFFSWTLPSDPILVGQNQVDLGLLTIEKFCQKSCHCESDPSDGKPRGVFKHSFSVTVFSCNFNISLSRTVLPAPAACSQNDIVCLHLLNILEY